MVLYTLARCQPHFQSQRKDADRAEGRTDKQPVCSHKNNLNRSASHDDGVVYRHPGGRAAGHPRLCGSSKRTIAETSASRL